MTRDELKTFIDLASQIHVDLEKIESNLKKSDSGTLVKLTDELETIENLMHEAYMAEIKQNGPLQSALEKGLDNISTALLDVHILTLMIEQMD